MCDHDDSDPTTAHQGASLRRQETCDGAARAVVKGAQGVAAALSGGVAEAGLTILDLMLAARQERARDRAATALEEGLAMVERRLENVEWAQLVDQTRCEQLLALAELAARTAESQTEKRQRIATAVANQILTPVDDLCFAFFRTALERVDALHVAVAEKVAAIQRETAPGGDPHATRSRVGHCSLDDLINAFDKYHFGIIEAVIADLVSVSVLADTSAGNLDATAYSSLYVSNMGLDFLDWVSETAATTTSADPA